MKAGIMGLDCLRPSFFASTLPLPLGAPSPLTRSLSTPLWIPLPYPLDIGTNAMEGSAGIEPLYATVKK